MPPAQDRSPEDYVAAFRGADFEVSVRRFGYTDFVLISTDSRYYPK